MVRPYSSRALRQKAAAAYIQAGGDIQAAKAIFVAAVPQHGVAKLAKYILKWGKQFSKEGHVMNAARDKGPSVKVPMPVARKAAKIYQRGFTNRGKQLPFSSIKDALEHSKALRRIKEDCKCCAATLLRHMHRADPVGMQTSPVHFKAKLSDKQKAARQRVAETLLSRSDHYFNRVFWLDAAKVVIRPRNYRGTLGGRQIAGGGYVLEDPRMKWNKKDAQVIHFYVVVNAVKGAVSLVEVTGTTGKDYGFRVSVR